MNEVDKFLEINLSTFIVDVLEKALCLPNEVLDKFILPKRGIYLYNSTKPLLNLEDDKYFFENGGEVFNLEDVKNCKGYILDNRGNVVLTEKRIRRINSILSDTPNTPIVAIEFIINNIENFILRSTISNSVLFHNNIELLKNSKDLDFVNEQLLIILSDIYEDINDFINTDIYNIYEFDRKGNLLVIHKKYDFRIIEYYKQKELLNNININ